MAIGLVINAVAGDTADGDSEIPRGESSIFFSAVVSASGSCLLARPIKHVGESMQ